MINFKAKTQDAYSIKVLAELLSNILKTGSFEIDKHGITLRMMDNHKKLLIDIVLQADDFNHYSFNSDQKLNIGINLIHFYKMLKSIKKKDSLEFYIDDENDKEFNIKVVPRERNRETISTILIQSIQSIIIDKPNGYSKSVIVSSSEFQKMMKDMSNISSVISVESYQHNIKFCCNGGNVIKRNVIFGEHMEEHQEKILEQSFTTEQLARITKLAGLSNSLKIYPGNPILFTSSVGSIGKIEIYIKSKEQLLKENAEFDENINDDDEDDDDDM